jgi:carbazole 1,9a-dioxygenase terminal dioxygenase component
MSARTCTPPPGDSYVESESETKRFYGEEDGWSKERLYRPDLVITEWRKLASAHNRGIQPRA